MDSQSQGGTKIDLAKALKVKEVKINAFGRGMRDGLLLMVC